MFLNLLQASVEGQSQFLSNLTTSEAFFMVIVVGIVGMIVQWRLDRRRNCREDVALQRCE